MKYHLHTFGCKVNTYDAGLIQKNMNASSFDFDLSHVHLLNTCAVTAEAVKEAVKLIRKIKVKDPFAKIVVTGCAAQVDTQTFSDLPGVDLVVANSHKGMLPFILQQHFSGANKEKVFKSNIFRKEDLEAGGGIEEKHSRAFLKIQDGCNAFCSYCIIPYARGKSRSIPVKDLIHRVNELSKMGYQEAVLTGVHIGDYLDEGSGLNWKLEDLLEQLLKHTQMPRFRLTSLEPVEISERLLDLYQDSRVCAHFHMSIQSAESKVLKDMKRQYGQEQVIEALNRIKVRVPKAFVGMDVIAGFPTETQESFEETYRVLSETPWTRLHVFPYSERSGTKAATLEVQVPMSERKSRARLLRDLSSHRMQSEALKQIGSIKELLFLNTHKQTADDFYSGLSQDYWNVKIPNPQKLQHPSSFARVHIEGVDTHSNVNLESVLIGRFQQGGLQ